MRCSGTRHIASGLSKAYRTERSSGFQEAFNNLDARMARSRLNTTNRNLAYRPRRAKDLTSRKDPIVVNGQKLEPTTWEGIPGKKGLARCIKLASTPQEFSEIKGLIRDYAEYFPSNLTGRHAARLIRQAAILGMYNQAATFASSDSFKGVLDAEFHLEQMRLHAIRMKHTQGGAVKLAGIDRLYSRVDGLQSKLLKVVALNNLVIVSNKDVDEIKKHLSIAIKDAEQEISALNPDQTISQYDKKSLSSAFINWSLGLDALRANNANCTNLESLFNAAKAKVSNTLFVERYVHSVEAGFVQEFTVKPLEEVAESEAA